MRTYQLLSQIVGSSLLLVLLAALPAGCSLPLPPSSTTSSPAAACPSPVPLQAVSGTIAAINGTTLLIAAPDGATVKAIYTNTTRFTRQTRATISALQDGTFAFVAVTAHTSNTYPTASRISLLSRAIGPRTGSAWGSGPPCGGRGLRGGPGGQDFAGSNGTSRAIAGTISQFRGDTLTVTDLNQTTYAVTLDANTQIVQISQVAAPALQVGMAVNLVGVRNRRGVMTARAVMILLPGAGV